MNNPHHALIERDELFRVTAEAYEKGASDVHAYWKAGNDIPHDDPEFTEAANDYATAALDPYSSAVRGTALESLPAPLQDADVSLGSPRMRPTNIDHQVRATIRTSYNDADVERLRAFVTRIAGMTDVECDFTDDVAGYEDGFALRSAALGALSEEGR